MAFDPDAFLASGGPPTPAAKPGNFDPDVFLAQPEAPKAKQKPVMNAGLQGTTQGIFGGFLDEVGGAVKGLAENRDIRNIGHDYRRERDAIRADNRTAEEYDPTAFRAGQIGGGLATAFVPGLGVAKGAGLAGKAANAAAGGAVFGLGASEADLTKGEVVGAAKDTLIGAGTGAATAGLLHGAGKVVGKVAEKVGQGAERRVGEFEFGDAIKGVTKPTREKAYAKLGGKDLEAGKGELQKLLKAEPEIAQAMRKEPGAAMEIIGARKADIGKQIGGVYQAADAASPGVAKTKVVDALESMVAKQEKAGNAPGVRTLKTEIKELKGLWKDQDAIPAETLHGIAQRYGEASFSGNLTSIPAAKRLGREMTGKVRDLLEGHVKDVSGDEAAKALKALNKTYSQTRTLEDIAKARARAAATGSGKTFFEKARDTFATGLGATGVVGSVLGGDLTTLGTLGAGAAAIKGGGLIVRESDRALARLYNAVKNGGAVQDAFKQAIEAGVPRATAEGVIRKVGERD